jgi:Glycosyltransferase family 9 (heptosyltransferase)
MSLIRKTDDKPLDKNAGIMVPARFVPSFRVCFADEHGGRNRILFRMHGGLGDIICAEPAVRFAMKHFKGLEFNLMTLYPALFQHLKFEKIFTPENVAELVMDDYLMFENTDTANQLAAEFVCHTLMHGIDYASLYMWRQILPHDEREIVLRPSAEEFAKVDAVFCTQTDVVVHAGKTWPSRTFPKNWWDKIISSIKEAGYRPVLIGGDVDPGFGPKGAARASTVEVDVPEGVLDLRYKLTISETVALLKRARVLLSNDSSPVHMATTGDAWIGFLSTVKHPDHMYTYRKGAWRWRMQDLALGGIYQSMDTCPNKKETIRVDLVDVVELLSWLPTPKSVVEWSVDKMKNFT